jgi:Cu/Ag efflux pump CusA
MSANLMSLGGLAIALGMLVDAAVVVVENVVQHLGHDKASGKLPACTSCSAPCARWPHRWPRAC